MVIIVSIIVGILVALFSCFPALLLKKFYNKEIDDKLFWVSVFICFLVYLIIQISITGRTTMPIIPAVVIYIANQNILKIKDKKEGMYKKDCEKNN